MCHGKETSRKHVYTADSQEATISHTVEFEAI